MQRFKKILLVTDGEERSIAGLERAAALAIRNQAQLTVVKTFNLLPSHLQRLVIPLQSEDLWQIAADEESAHLERFVARTRQTAPTFATKILCGTPFLEIIREVLRNQHDLVMITAEGKIDEVLFGSTSMHLMRKCPCPVWVMSGPADAICKYPSGRGSGSFRRGTPLP